MPPAQPPQQDSVPSAPEMPKKKRSTMLVFALMLLLLIVASAGIYMWQNNQVKSKQKALTQAQAQLSTALTTSDAIVALPTNKDAGHSDCSKNFTNTVYASLTPKPVDGYQAYLAVCLGDGQTVPSLQGLTPTSTATVVVFKTSENGSKKFVYGAGTGEPFCMSKKILPANVAADLSTATKLPICKTF